MAEKDLSILEKYADSMGGVEFVDTGYTVGNSKSVRYRGDYAKDLNEQAMMSDDVFQKMQSVRGVDWNHVKKVMDVSDERYGAVGSKVKSQQKAKKRAKLEKIVDLLVEIMDED